MVRAASYRPKWDRVDHMNGGRQRALELRNQGITVNPHSSWKRATEAQKQARREAEKEWDDVDRWFAEIRLICKRIEKLCTDLPTPATERARAEFAALEWGAWGEDVPF